MLNACQLLVCMHVCVHAQRERETGQEWEREREKESLNKSQKSSFEIIHTDHECILEKTVCTTVKNMVSKAKSYCFRSYFKQSQAISPCSSFWASLCLCFPSLNRNDDENDHFFFLKFWNKRVSTDKGPKKASGILSPIFSVHGYR